MEKKKLKRKIEERKKLTKENGIKGKKRRKKKVLVNFFWYK